jgi:hypothetical protein
MTVNRAPDLTGWVPIRLYWHEDQLWVDWGYVGSRPFTAPFFDQEIDACVANPANALFRHQTSIEPLSAMRSELPCCAPTGFVFHLSRCGSTLVSQMLAAVPENIVLSEPSIIDWILRAHVERPNVTDQQRVAWLRDVIYALGQKRSAVARHCFVKFYAWHILALPLIKQAFPDVPWVFMYRDPVEVIVSQRRHPAAQMIPVSSYVRLLGVDWTGNGPLAQDEYCARVLARLGQAAVDQLGCGQGLLLNYNQLPSAVFSALLGHFKVGYSTTNSEKMRAASGFNAKDPKVPFAQDSTEKQEQATDELRQIARQWVSPVYERLEVERERILTR